MPELDLTRISELKEELRDAVSNWRRERYLSEKESQDAFIAVLKSGCALIRDAESESVTNLDIAIDQVDKLINKAVNFACGDSEMYDFFPSFAHSSECPVLEDEFILSSGTIKSINAAFHLPPGDPLDPEFANLKPWTETTKPHPKSTPLARFRDRSFPLSVDSTTPVAKMIYDARCDITSKSITSPIQMNASSDGTCLSLLSTGGYRDCDPILTCFILDNGDNVFKDVQQFTIGLSEAAYHSTMDASRKLIFAADSRRIKSYKWGISDDNGDPLAVHTMKSRKFDGPLALLSDGRLLRAGKGAAAVWNIDALETHGPKGRERKRIGKPIDTDDFERDNEIEDSSGSPAHQQIKFADSTARPARWHAHPSIASTMLCASAVSVEPRRLWCGALDLDHGGKTAARYLGHGGEVNGFSTSHADPAVFITACSDGCVRLYDVRHPLPVLTMAVGKGDTACDTALLVHPDGIPSVFAGTERAEHIQLWDIRARCSVYELATGNNAVVDMVWDSERSVLYAATECNYRPGSSRDYRRAKLPEWQKAVEVQVDDNDDIDMGDWEDIDDDDDDRRWPRNAYQTEGYFGHMFDAGSHTLFRYSFKEDPDKILPVYGNACW